MAARAYSPYKSRKAVAPTSPDKGKSPDGGAKMKDATPFKCPNWGDQLENPSNIGWGSDTEKIAQYPKSKGVSGKGY